MLNLTGFSNAFFESVSGFTSTGLTMVRREDLLTHSVQWWRSFTQWVGGIGVIVFVTLFHNPRIITVDKYYERNDLAGIIFETSSAFGNVGLSAGITGPALALVPKCLIICIMLAGRLELIPVILILGCLFREREALHGVA